MTENSVLVRRARSVVVCFETTGLVGYEFLAHTVTPLGQLGLEILAGLEQWAPATAVVLHLAPAWGMERAVAELSRLMALGFVVSSDTHAAWRDNEYERHWEWGVKAGVYHFGIKGTRYLNPADTIATLTERVAERPPVPLFRGNDGCSDVVQLSAPRTDGIFATMRARRSFRGFDPAASQPVTDADLKDCLHSGLGIVGFAETDTGWLPLKMTPSGGARNPYEAYVCAYSVAGLAPGLYHYAAIDNTLGRIDRDRLPAADTIVMEQPWFHAASALIVLVANFDRTMWKYGHPTGFRVVLIEAGHIAQNMLLAATANNLACVPSCAIDDEVAMSLFDLHPIKQSAVYAVAVGPRGSEPTMADVRRIIPVDEVYRPPDGS